MTGRGVGRRGGRCRDRRRAPWPSRPGRCPGRPRRDAAAATQTNLGVALLILGERTGERAHLAAAREAVAGAFAVVMQAGQEHRRSEFAGLLQAIDRALAARPGRQGG